MQKGKRGKKKHREIEDEGARFLLPGVGWLAFHFQVASFLRFMATNLSFTQFVT